MESSELPPKSPVRDKHLTLNEVETLADAEGRESAEDHVSGVINGDEEETDEVRRERGDPVSLPEGITKEEYFLGPGTLPLSNSQEVVAEAGPSKSTRTTNGFHEDPYGDVPTFNEPDLTLDISKAHDDMSMDAPPSPVLAHPLPPSAPHRRVRELRLDLRTLDAAALFALETWRRELLGLGRLDLEHPDSVWFEEPELVPTPSPPPLPPRIASKSRSPLVMKRKRGRPRKLRTLELPEDQFETESRSRSPAAMNEQRSRSPLSATVDRHDQKTDGDNHGFTAIDTASHLEEPATFHGTGPDPSHPLENEASPEPVASEGESELVEQVEDDSSYEVSPSPEILLEDGFDRRHDQDPDFEPPIHFQRKAEQARPKRPSEIAVLENDLVVESVSGSFDRVEGDGLSKWLVTGNGDWYWRGRLELG